MIRFKCCTVFASFLAAACAAQSTDMPETAGIAQASFAAEATAVARTIELDSTELDSSEVVTCRDTTQIGTNMLITRCMTEAGWRQYRRTTAMQAKAFLRKLRGEY